MRSGWTRSPSKQSAPSRTARWWRPAEPSPTGEADAVVSAGNTGAMLAAGLFQIRRAPRSRPSRDRRRHPGARGPVGPDRRRRERRRRGRAPAPVRARWARSSPRTSSRSPGPSVRLLSIGEEPEKGNQLTLEAHELLAAADLNFGGNAEGRDILRAAPATSSSCDGFTGNIALKAARGDDRDPARIAPRGDHRHARRGNVGGAADPARGAPAARAPRPGHLRRRLPSRPARPRRHRPRQLLGDRDRERDPPRRARRRPRRRRPAGHAAVGAETGGDCMIGALSSPHDTTR